MKKISILILCILPMVGFCQKTTLESYHEAQRYIQTDQIDSAYYKFKLLEESIPKSDTLYEHAVWYRTMTASHLEEVARYQEDFETSLKYGLDALEGIKKGKFMFADNFASREFFMVKNIIVSHYGLGNFKEGKAWKDKMYTAQKDSLLPEGIDQYFNFDFFKMGDKNVWGYEWFAPLPKDRFSSSFTKVVYYVYSTNPDGSDKEQLYRLYVLMFHGNQKNFDYVLTKRLTDAAPKGEFSGTLYQYTYKEDIDFEKLKKDVKEVVSGNMKSLEDFLKEEKAKKEKKKQD